MRVDPTVAAYAPPKMQRPSKVEKTNRVGLNIVLYPLVAKKLRQSGGLGILRGVIHGFSEEARTRDVASLTFVRFAFIGCNRD